jgi:hypothetical protein
VNAYEKPVVVDHGTLVDLTAAIEGCLDEDGGSKTTRQHHTDPCV